MQTFSPSIYRAIKLQERHESIGVVKSAKINAMRDVIAVLIVTGVFWFSGAASAQVNYDLLPGYGTKHGYPPTVTYRAWVLSYRDSKYYSCLAAYEFDSPKTPTLICRPMG